MAKPGITLENETEFRAALATLPDNLRKRGLVDAFRKAARIVVKSAQSMVDVDSGTLKRSLGLVIRRPKRAKGDPYAVVGARRGYSRQVTRLGWNGLFSYTQKAVPANYAHLVELGHYVVSGGTLNNKGAGSRTRLARSAARTGQGSATQYILPRPFLRPAFEKSKSPVVSSLVESLTSFQTREAARIARLAARKGRK